MKRWAIISLSVALLWSSSVAVQAQTRKRPAKPGKAPEASKEPPASSQFDPEQLSRISERIKVLV